jgi:diguanylate cyclase
MPDAKTISTKALALLGTLGCEPTPMAYAVAYAYVEDPEGPVAREVMREVARCKRLRASEVARLHASHIQPGDPGIEAASAALGRHIGEAIDLVGESVASSREASDRLDALAPHESGAAALVLRAMTEAQGGLLARLQQKNDELDALRRRYEETLEETRRDPLTGLANRRAFDERLALAMRDAAEGVRPVSLLLGDIDLFKGINDAYGHGVGDQVIKLIGKTMRSAIRPGDTSARLGGEEYGVILPGADLARAGIVAERIRETVAGFRRLASASHGEGRKVTLSIGVAEAAPGDDPGSLYERADACLYAAKRAGRNRVVTEEALPDPGPRGPVPGR